jgi:succinate-semialdehyde dehydrogenase/glutarate-semialdehyde dehydrogenase
MAQTYEPDVESVDGGEMDALRDQVTVVGDREALSVEAPFTGEEIGTVPAGTEEDVDAAVERARAAQPDWEDRSVEERCAVLSEVHDMVLDRQDEILDLLQLESGKARETAFAEIIDVANNARYYANNAESYLARKKRNGIVPVMTRAYEYHHPVGVVGLITPWNYPLTLTVSDALPALVAGNAVVLKPSTNTPYTALFAKRLLVEAGVPEDVFQVVTGSGSDLGDPLIDRVDFVDFTGSSSTGRHIAERAGRNLIDCSLELGGKNPMIVFDDADVEAAVRGAVRGCFTNAGQLCISIERLYVHASIYDEFVERFAEAAEAVTLGTEYEYGTDMGSLISEEQLEKVTEHVEDARERGATIRAGGQARPDVGPYFYEPTILEGVSEDMKPGCEETFGPVVSVYEFDTVEEAVERANDSRYGLNGSVWTEDEELAYDVAPRIECGTVNINEGFATAMGSVDAPMGGMKDSGLGRRHGEHGLLKYTEAQTVGEQRYGEMEAPPGVSDDTYTSVMTGYLRLSKRLDDLL